MSRWAIIYNPVAGSFNAARLEAIQEELVAALHAAADSEVMRAAAENMNLVSLLSGHSPAELFQKPRRPADR